MSYRNIHFELILIFILTFLNKKPVYDTINLRADSSLAKQISGNEMRLILEPDVVSVRESY